MKIQSYATWKKRENPTIYSVTDGIKWWAKQTVAPTIEHHGWKQCIFDTYYRDWEDRKPKERAIELVLETYGSNWTKGKEFVYYEYHGTNGYMDCMYVWCKEDTKKGGKE